MNKVRIKGLQEGNIEIIRVPEEDILCVREIPPEEIDYEYWDGHDRSDFPFDDYTRYDVFFKTNIEKIRTVRHWSQDLTRNNWI